MIILALETCFGACSVAACRDGEAPVCEFELRSTGHAEALLPMIERVMISAGISFVELDRICVTTGPGSFTGMRIGISAARALALVTGAEVVGVPTLEVMAATARRQSEQKLSAGSDSCESSIVIAVDARKDEVYIQVFGREHRAPAAVLTYEAAARLVLGGEAILAGSGATRVAAEMQKVGSWDAGSVTVIDPDLQPSALDLCVLGHDRPPSNRPVYPLYLRPPDAKPQDGKQIPRLT